MTGTSGEVTLLPMFLDDLEAGPRTYVYGTGALGRSTHRGLTELGIAVSGFIDSSKGGELAGLPILQVDEYLSQRAADDVLVLGSSFGPEIVAGLEQRGFVGTLMKPHTLVPARFLWSADDDAAERAVRVAGLPAYRDACLARGELYWTATDVSHYLARIIQYCQRLNPGGWLIAAPDSTGDNIMHLQLAKAFRAEYGFISDKITIICHRQHAELVRLWQDDIHSAVAVGPEIMRALRDRFMSIGDVFAPGVPLAPTLWAIPSSLHSRTYGATMLDFIKMQMRLPGDAPLAPPRVLDGWRTQAAVELAKLPFVAGRTVILFPDTVTMPQPPRAFWLALADAFRQRGFEIIWNGSPQWAADCPGSSTMMLPFTLLPPALELAGHGIFSRSGIADLCCSDWVDAKKSVIYRRAAAGNYLAQTHFVSASTAAWPMEAQGHPMNHQAFTVNDGENPEALIAEILAAHDV